MVRSIRHILCCLILFGVSIAVVVAGELQGDASPKGGAASVRVVLPHATSLNEIARQIYPNDRVARDAYRTAVARLNPGIFATLKNAGSLPLTAGTVLHIPSGDPLPEGASVENGKTGSSAGSESTDRLGLVAKAAAQRGIHTCLKRIDQLSAFVTQGEPAGVFIFNTAQEADRRIVSTSMEVADQQKVRYASSTFAPYADDACGGVYEEVNWWPGSCSNVAVTIFPQFGSAGKLLHDIQMLDGGATVRVFLMPAGDGCISIKKEAVF